MIWPPGHPPKSLVPVHKHDVLVVKLAQDPRNVHDGRRACSIQPAAGGATPS